MVRQVTDGLILRGIPPMTLHHLLSRTGVFWASFLIASTCGPTCSMHDTARANDNGNHYRALDIKQFARSAAKFWVTGVWREHRGCSESATVHAMEMDIGEIEEDGLHIVIEGELRSLELRSVARRPNGPVAADLAPKVYVIVVERQPRRQWRPESMPNLLALPAAEYGYDEELARMQRQYIESLRLGRSVQAQRVAAELAGRDGSAGRK